MNDCRSQFCNLLKKVQLVHNDALSDQLQVTKQLPERRMGQLGCAPRHAGRCSLKRHEGRGCVERASLRGLTYTALRLL